MQSLLDGSSKTKFSEFLAGSDFGTVSKWIDLTESGFLRIGMIASTNFACIPHDSGTGSNLLEADVNPNC